MIGWHIGVRGYLSLHWALAAQANPRLKDADLFYVDANKIIRRHIAKSWARKVLLRLWDFTKEMRKHRNDVFHDSKLEASRQIRDANINNEIKKLYDNKASYDVTDHWYFEMPLALRLKELVRSRRRWLERARALAAKSGERASVGQDPSPDTFRQSDVNEGS